MVSRAFPGRTDSLDDAVHSTLVRLEIKTETTFLILLHLAVAIDALARLGAPCHRSDQIPDAAAAHEPFVTTRVIHKSAGNAKVTPQRIVHQSIDEQVVDVLVPQVVEETLEQVVVGPVRQPVEQFVEVARIIPQDVVQQRAVEKFEDAPEPQTLEEAAQAPQPHEEAGQVPRERPRETQLPVEQIVNVPRPQVREKVTGKPDVPIDESNMKTLKVEQIGADNVLVYQVQSREWEKSNGKRENVQREDPNIQEHTSKDIEVEAVAPATQDVVNARVTAQKPVHQRIVEQGVDAPVPQAVEEIQDRPTDGPVLHAAEQDDKVAKIIPQEHVQQRTVDDFEDEPVPQAIAEAAQVLQLQVQEEAVQRPVEQKDNEESSQELRVQVQEEAVQRPVEHMNNAPRPQADEIVTGVPKSPTQEDSGKVPKVEHKEVIQQVPHIWSDGVAQYDSRYTDVD